MKVLPFYIRVVVQFELEHGRAETGKGVVRDLIRGATAAGADHDLAGDIILY